MATQRLPEDAGRAVTDAGTSRRRGGGIQTVRRLITYSLLFAMVAIAAIGLSGLLGRLLDAGNQLGYRDVGGLAQSLAFTVIAGPLAALLWWLMWRGLGDSTDRSSIAWGLYLAAMSTVALITSTTSLLLTAASLITGDWRPRELATGLVWAGVWLWHSWMWRHPSKRPTRLVGVGSVIGSAVGLVLWVGGAVTAFGGLLDTAVLGLGDAITLGDPWWRSVLQALVWAVGGWIVWWWHWMHDGVRKLHTGFAEVALVIITGLGAVILCLTGVATALFVLLRLAFDQNDSIPRLLDPLGQAVAAAALGALVWAYHRGVVVRGIEPVRQATRLVTSGVGLAAAASGVGVIVNSILAAVGTPLADFGVRTLLLGGISALVVGGPIWWVFWKPAAAADPAFIGSTGRRVYLVVVFGVSAIVALITLLVIGYRVFEFTLDNVSGQILIDRVRAALGLLTATGLAAGYHFAIWRSDRSAIEVAPVRHKSIGQVILVTGSDPEPLRLAIDAATGATVTVWMRSDADGTGATADQLVTALAGVSGERVLVVTGAGGRIDVIPLKD